MIVALVAAVARGGVIGHDGRLPWRLPEDMARFRELTVGHAVVMGRRTWDSLPERFRPLPGRRNIVVTRKQGWAEDGAERAGSLDEALALVANEEHVFVVGGAEIYAAALPLADELLLTEIDLEVEGDTLFPAWDRAAFVEVAREEHTAADGTRFAFVRYERSSAPASIPATLGTVHASREELDARLPELRALPTDVGTLELIVVRPGEGERETLDTAELTIEDGLVGDRWAPGLRADGSPDRHNQLTIASTPLLGLIAESDRWPLAGDNLLVDMGLDEASLPAGTRLAIGDTVIVEISEEPHTGCAKFSARFGSDALKFINSPEGRRLRLRGVNARVVVPGTISVGDPIRRL